MRKIISLFSALLICLSLCGCKEEPVLPKASDYISDLKLYIDDSHTGSTRLLYALYTVTATDREIEFFYYTQGKSSVGSGAVATLNGINSYYDLFSANAALSKPFEITPLKSPSEGQLIVMGESATFVSAFLVAENDIKNGESFILTLKATHSFNESEETSLSSLIHVESAESLARSISPDGKTKEEIALAEEVEEIEAELSGEINKALEGSWEYTVDGVKTKMTFKSKKYTEYQTVGSEKEKATAKGSYSIRKKVILVTLSSGEELRIPYTYSDKKLTVNAPKKAE